MKLNNDKYLLEFNDCISAVLASAIINYGDNPFYMFALTWSFDFNINSLDINKKAEADMIGGFEGIKMLEKIYGLTFVFDTYNDDTEKSRGKIRDFLNKYDTIIIQTDVFHCPWSEAYHKYNIEHYIIIKGYNEKNNNFLCSDPFLGVDDVFLDLTKSCNSSNKIIGINKNAKVDFQWDDLMYFASTHYLSKEASSKENLLKFAEFIRDDFNIKEEIKGYEIPYMCPFFVSLKSICKSRENFCKLLEYHVNQSSNNDYRMAYEQLKIIDKQWQTLYLIFYKMIYHSDLCNDINKAYNKIIEISKIENVVTKMILHISSDRNTDFFAYR